VNQSDKEIIQKRETRPDNAETFFTDLRGMTLTHALPRSTGIGMNGTAGWEWGATLKTLYLLHATGRSNELAATDVDRGLP
jgi:hypothetical protein